METDNENRIILKNFRISLTDDKKLGDLAKKLGISQASVLRLLIKNPPREMNKLAEGIL